MWKDTSKQLCCMKILGIVAAQTLECFEGTRRNNALDGAFCGGRPEMAHQEMRQLANGAVELIKLQLDRSSRLWVTRYVISRSGVVLEAGAGQCPPERAATVNYVTPQRLEARVSATMKIAEKTGGEPNNVLCELTVQDSATIAWLVEHFGIRYAENALRPCVLSQAA